MSTVLGSDQGSVLSIVHVDGTVDVWSIPQNAVIDIQTARGFGSLTETSVNASLSAAESDIDSHLVSAGAQ